MSQPRATITIPSLYDDLERRIRQLGDGAPEVDASRKIVEAALDSGEVHYGINTGFGALAQMRIGGDQLSQLQRNLLLSHAVGVGELIPKDITRLMLQLKIHALALGHSGVSREAFDRLLLFAERDLIPAVPSRGSVGASGDLAPLAHLALPLIGHGAFWTADGTSTEAAADVLEREGLASIELQAKDGLAMINGTQMMSAYGSYVLHRALKLLKEADVLAAMSLEALQGSVKPFDARVHRVRAHPGQVAVAENVRYLLKDSEIVESHRNCGKVQDPYCLRCVPQVHGAVRDAAAQAARVLEVELNAVTDNPLVFPDKAAEHVEEQVISAGHFHGMPLALAMSYLKASIPVLASISERRLNKLVDPSTNDGLPAFLIGNEDGTESGHMIVQYTAAAIVNDLATRAHPASVYSVPTSANAEDHVSMGANEARHVLAMVADLGKVLGLELYTAAQALDLRRDMINAARDLARHTDAAGFAAKVQGAPPEGHRDRQRFLDEVEALRAELAAAESFHPGTAVSAAHEALRERIAFLDRDRAMDGEVAEAVRLVAQGTLLEAARRAEAGERG